MKVHFELDHIDTPFSASAKLGALGDFLTDLNPLRLRNEMLLFWLESGLPVSMFRRILEIGRGNKLLIALIGSARKSSWISVLLDSASAFCRRRIEASCLGLGTPLLLFPLAPFADESLLTGSSYSQLPSVPYVPRAAEELSNVSLRLLWKPPLRYTDISVLQSMALPF